MNTPIRFALAGCGRAARIHLERLLALPDVAVVACADPDPAAAADLARQASRDGGNPAHGSDHLELIASTRPDVLAVFTPHLFHYRLAMDAIQANCHVFIEKPLSTNLQEAVDIVRLARARGRVVAVGHQYRLCPSLIEARHRVQAGHLGSVRLVIATLARDWLDLIQTPGESWRLDPRIAGGGLLCDAGDHLIDAALWLVGLPATEVFALQQRTAHGLDFITAATARLGADTLMSLNIAGSTPGNQFEIVIYGDRGRLRVTDSSLWDETSALPVPVTLPDRPVPSVDADFVAALKTDQPPCCPAEDALDTVALLEAIARCASSGQRVQLSSPRVL